MRLGSAAGSIRSALLDVVYPRVCAGCGHASDVEGSHICWNCMSEFQIVTRPFCRVCGDPVDGAVDMEYTCSFCRDRPPWFDAARSAARYRGPLQTALHAFKYGRMTHLGRDFATILAACVKTQYGGISFDAATFVPLYPRKERHRTYNQAQILARSLARDIGVPYLGGCLRRGRETASQTNLTAPERANNVRDAFIAEKRDWLAGRAILLVDDVMTTGATVNECAKALKSAGSVAVHVVTVARG